MASAPNRTDTRDAAAGNADPTPSGWMDRIVNTRLETWRRWWRVAVLETVDQEAVIEKRREEAYTSPRYLFMLAMSAGIAILGLLLSSPAVVIGAMLIAPLMGPIIGAGFALAIGDYSWLRGSAVALAAGTVLGVALTALIVFVSPLQTVTPEIAARTQPNLFDLAVAVFSALAGAYSMIRGREGTIVGVAIATALMPPLGVVGFGLATANWTVFSGALLLYVTNLMTIALVATIMARIYGFSARLSEKQTRWQTALIIAVFVGLAVPLFFSLRQIVWETNAARIIRTTVLAEAGSDARLSHIEFDLDADPVTVSATVLTPNPRSSAEQDSEAELAARLQRPIDLTLTQFRVGTGAEAEAIELLRAREDSQRALSEESRSLAERMALIAGVDPGEVTRRRSRGTHSGRGDSNLSRARGAHPGRIAGLDGPHRAPSARASNHHLRRSGADFCRTRCAQPRGLGRVAQGAADQPDWRIERDPRHRGAIASGGGRRLGPRRRRAGHAGRLGGRAGGRCGAVLLTQEIRPLDRAAVSHPRDTASSPWRGSICPSWCAAGCAAGPARRRSSSPSRREPCRRSGCAA